MADFVNLNLKGKQQFNTGDIKGGVNLDAFTTEEARKLADAFNTNKTGASANILDVNEVKALITILIQQAGDDLKRYKADAKQIFKELEKLGIDVSGLDYDSLVEFINQLLNAGEGIVQSTTDADGTIRTIKKSRVNNSNGSYSVKTYEVQIGSDGKETVLSDTVTHYNSDNKALNSYTTKSDGETVECSYVDENGNVYDYVVKETTLSADDSKVIVVEYDENGPTKRTVENGINTDVYEFHDGEQRLVSQIKNEGLANQINKTYIYNEDGTVTEIRKFNNLKNPQNGATELTIVYTDATCSQIKTQTERNQLYSETLSYNSDRSGTITTKYNDGSLTSEVSFNSHGKNLRAVDVVNGVSYEANYDGEGNTLGYVVDIGKSPADIAKQFGVDVEELLTLNADQVRGSGRNRYFVAGSVIKLPGMFAPRNENLVNMRSLETVQADIARRAQARREAKAEVEEMRVVTIKDLLGEGAYELSGHYQIGSARELVIMVANINIAIQKGGWDSGNLNLSFDQINGQANFTDIQMDALIKKVIELNPELFNEDGTLKFTNNMYSDRLLIKNGVYEINGKNVTLHFPTYDDMSSFIDSQEVRDADAAEGARVGTNVSEGQNIARCVHASVYYEHGTDEDRLNGTLKRINKDTAAYAVIAYKEIYKTDEGIFEAVYNDDPDIALNYYKNIYSYLVSKANELGIDCTEFKNNFNPSLIISSNGLRNVKNLDKYNYICENFDNEALQLAYKILAKEQVPLSQRAQLARAEVTSGSVESIVADGDTLASEAYGALQAQYKRNGWSGWTINGIKSIFGGTTYGDTEDEVLAFMVSLDDCGRAYFNAGFDKLKYTYMTLTNETLDTEHWNVLKDEYYSQGADAFKAKYKELTGNTINDDVFAQMETAFTNGCETSGVEAFKKQFKTEFGSECDPQMLAAYDLQMQQYNYALTCQKLSKVFKDINNLSQEELASLMQEYFPNDEIDYSTCTKDEMANAVRIGIQSLRTASGNRKPEDIRKSMLDTAKAIFPNYVEVMDDVLDYCSSQELTKGAFKMGLTLAVAVICGVLVAGPAGGAAAAKMTLSSATMWVAGVSTLTNAGDLAVREIMGDDVSTDEWVQGFINIGLDTATFSGAIKFARYLKTGAGLTQTHEAVALTSFDITTGIAGDFVREGEITIDGVIYNVLLASTNLIGLRKQGSDDTYYVLPTLDKVTSNPQTSTGLHVVSSISVGADKASKIAQEIDDFLKNPNIQIANLVDVRTRLDVISDRKLRRQCVAKLEKYVATLSPDAQATYRQGFTAVLSQSVDGILNGTKPLMPEHVRLIKEYAANIDDVNELNSLRERILTKQKTSRGTYYDTALKAIDNRIKQVQSAPTVHSTSSTTPRTDVPVNEPRPVEEPEVKPVEDPEVNPVDESVADPIYEPNSGMVDEDLPVVEPVRVDEANAGGVNEPTIPQDLVSPEQALNDVDLEVKVSKNLSLQKTWQSCKDKVNQLLTHVGDLTESLKVTYRNVLSELDTLITTATGALKSKFQALKASLVAKFSKLVPHNAVKMQVEHVDLQAPLEPRPDLVQYVYNPNRSSAIHEGAQLYVDNSKNATLEHASFILSQKELFKGFDTSGWWTQFTPADQHHGAWKMHLFSVDELDWQNLSEAVIPYLKKNGVEFKTLSGYASPEALAAGGSIQAGKAFTIYPRDNAHMEQIARDLDYIIRNNQLGLDGSSIVGDRQMGDTGRLFYRYEYNTVDAIDEIVDTSTSEGRRRYNSLYDKNEARVKRHGEGRYLADDMTEADDPWLNFDPADPNSKPSSQNSVAEPVKVDELSVGRADEPVIPLEDIVADGAPTPVNPVNPSTATPSNNVPVDQQLTRTNVYRDSSNPNAELTTVTYKLKGQKYSIKVPKNISKSNIESLMQMDMIRRDKTKEFPQFASMSAADQIRFARAYQLSLSDPAQRMLFDKLLVSSNHTRLSVALNDQTLLNQTLKDISELSALLPEKGVNWKKLGGLIELKQTNPESFQKLLDSGIFELIKDGKVSYKVLSHINKASDFSPQMYADLALVQQGKSVVPEFPVGTDLNTAFSQTKVGDAVEVGGKMYLNDGNTLIEWNMTKEKYLELFPPVERFATCQGSVGNCHLIQSMVLGMNNPKARVQFLQSFSLQGNDVVVTVKGLEDYHGSHTFTNGEIVLSSNGKHVTGCKGMQMYEQTYSYVALRPESKGSVSDYVLPDINERSAYGAAYQTMADVFGKGSHFDMQQYKISSYTPISIRIGSGYDCCTELKSYFAKNPDKTIGLKGLSLTDADKLLTEFANNTDYLLSLSTVPKPNGAVESSLLAQYNLLSSHAYSIVGYDNATKMVKIINPHSAAAVTEIPLSEFHKYLNHLDFLKL